MQDETLHPFLPSSSLNSRGARQRFPAGSLSQAVLEENEGDLDPPRISGIVPRTTRKRRLTGGEFQDPSDSCSSDGGSKFGSRANFKKRAKANVKAGGKKEGIDGIDESIDPQILNTLSELNENLKKYNTSSANIEKRAEKEKEERELAEKRAQKEKEAEKNKPLEEFLSTVSQSEIEELKSFEAKEREYQKQLEENVYFQFAVAVASQTRVRNKYEYVNNTFVNWMNQIGADWSGFVYGGPREIAEAALKTLPFPSTLLYATPESGASGIPGNSGKVEKTINVRQDAIRAQMDSEAIRKDLYKAILEMRKRKKALDAFKLASRPSPNLGYDDILTLELRTRVDLVLQIVYTVNYDWRERQPSAPQIIRYKRSRILLSAAVANDILETRLNTLATPKSRMDRKDVSGARNSAILALARIPTEEIMANQIGFGGGSDSFFMIGGNFNPIPPGGSSQPMISAYTPTFRVTAGHLPISTKL